MVGWSRHNTEADSRRRHYRQWFDSLSIEQQEKIRLDKETQQKKDGPKIIALLAIGFLTLLSWPILATWHAHKRWEAEWNAGRVISQNIQQICKEVEYCAPCSPIHHWHKKVFCEQNKK